MDFLNPQNSFSSALQWPVDDFNFNFNFNTLDQAPSSHEPLRLNISTSPGSLTSFTGTPSPNLEYGDSPLSSSAPNIEFGGSPLTSNPPNQALVRIKKKPTPRKGHTKSRTGCFTCKKRRIKCQETRPACENCRRSGLPCEYPRPRIEYPPSTSNAPQFNTLQSTPTVFTMTDMRIFHHFLTRSHPHLPVGGGFLWTDVVPRYAHQYDFLMHAILALGASHMTLTSGDNLNREALQHRVRAVASLNKAIAQPMVKDTDPDARFATFFALAFQTTCMQDGLQEWLTMLRGCVMQGIPLPEHSVFVKARNKALVNALQTAKDNESDESRPQFNYDFLNGFAASLKQIEPLCVNPAEKCYLGKLDSMGETASHDPLGAYFAFVQLYWFVGHLSATDFATFVNPSNAVSQILVAHFLAIHLLLRDLDIYESFNRATPAIYHVMGNWLHTIDNSLHPAMKPYNEWPMQILSKHAVAVCELPKIDPRFELGASILDAPHMSPPLLTAA